MIGPFSYIGGKRSLANKIIEMFPEHTTYVEPFAGGAQVFFRKEPSKVEILNDLDGEVVNFFRVCQQHYEELVRQQRSRLYSVFVDEVQNLVAADTDFEVLFSEARKFGVGIVTANQFLAQLPPKMRSAIQAIGIRVFFQLSSEDANQVSQEIDGGRSMAERLRNLPPRHFVLKSGNLCAQEVVTPQVYTSKSSAKEFVERSNLLHAKRREDVERDILTRRPRKVKEVLDGWE